MRSLVSPSIALAAALLAGVAVAAGPSPSRSPERGAEGTSAPLAPARAQDRATSPVPTAAEGRRGTFLAPAIDFSRLAATAPQEELPVHEFFFTRAIYSGSRGGWGRRGQSWATDYPKADHQFMVVVKRLTNIDGYDYHNAVRLDDPNLRRFPFLYALEVGYMRLSSPEVEGLRNYLLAGGFLVIDDFWGTREWANFVHEIRRVLPGREIEELSVDHPLFDAFYHIEEIRQVPGFGRGIAGRPTFERDGYTPHVYGIHDDDGRLMVVVNFNTDLGDAWEHAESPYYPLEYSTYAYEMGVNMIVYGLSH